MKSGKNLYRIPNFVCFYHFSCAFETVSVEIVSLYPIQWHKTYLILIIYIVDCNFFSSSLLLYPPFQRAVCILLLLYHIYPMNLIIYTYKYIKYALTLKRLRSFSFSFFSVPYSNIKNVKITHAGIGKSNLTELKIYDLFSAYMCLVRSFAFLPMSYGVAVDRLV